MLSVIIKCSYITLVLVLRYFGYFGGGFWGYFFIDDLTQHITDVWFCLGFGFLVFFNRRNI